MKTPPRPDLGFCVSYLATRMHAPTKQDDVKLDRVYQYLARTAAAGITLSPDSFQIHAWIDASYAIHPDRKSHSGTVISLRNNGGPIFTRSAKQKLIALHDGLHHVIWMRYLLRELGADPPPAVIYQDNMSTITLAQRGPGVVGHTRHIEVRYFYAKDLVDRGVIAIEYLPSPIMRADILTKPHVGSSLYKLSQSSSILL